MESPISTPVPVTPPPLPATRPIRYRHFEATGAGFLTAGLDRRRMDEASNQALAWLNANSSIEIVSIDSTFGNMLAIVTVWYRE